MCKFHVCSAHLGVLSCKMSQHTVPSYWENTTVTLSNNFFFSNYQKKKAKQEISFRPRKVPQEVGWRQLITCQDLPQICIKRCLFGFVHFLYCTTPFPTTSISLASECLPDVGISGLLNQILHWDSSAWPIWNYIVFLLICVILDALLLTWVTERGAWVCISLCASWWQLLGYRCVFLQSVTHSGRCENPEAYPDRGI